MFNPLIDSEKRFLILGAGPTGLGAAYRLRQLGCRNFQVVDGAGKVGGLATSFRDPQGFLWDLGGHILDSHYEYFDKLLEQALGNDWTYIPRQTWIHLDGRRVPYPIQYHLRHLSPEQRWQCIQGLIRCVSETNGKLPATFEEWLCATYGAGLTDLFMRTYNFKVWAYPAEAMDCSWLRDRIPAINLEKVIYNLLEERDDDSWGPNLIRFPTHGGTGAIWDRLADLIGNEHISLNKTVVGIDPINQTAQFQDGTTERYDALLSTMPLDQLVRLTGLDHLKDAAGELRFSTTHIIGIGITGSPNSEYQDASWIYFPDDDSPFHRATIFSNYSSDHVPSGNPCWSIMAEVSESVHRPINSETVVEETIRALRQYGLITCDHSVISSWHKHLHYGYPTPFLGRDAVLTRLHAGLEPYNIFSRGRFGGWKFEVSDQDHSVMQGVELINRLILGIPEVTYWFPNVANNRTYSTRRSSPELRQPVAVGITK